MKAKAAWLFSLALVLFLPSSAVPASFKGLGDLPGGDFYSQAMDISADGTVVVGQSCSSDQAPTREAFRWSQSTGMVGLGWIPSSNLYGSYAAGVSSDGAIVVGTSWGGMDWHSFRWSATDGIVDLGRLPNVSFSSVGSSASAVSADGSVIVGSEHLGGSGANHIPFRWTESEGKVGVPWFGNELGRANDVSAAGRVMVGGAGIINVGIILAVRWVEDTGTIALHDPQDYVRSEALSVSGDGSVIVGYCDHFVAPDISYPYSREAFRWSESGGMVDLGFLPSIDANPSSTANGVSHDGSVIVGTSRTDFGDEAFIWDEENGMRSLRDVLVLELAMDLTGWNLTSAAGISADGCTIAGNGVNPDGKTEAWLANLTPEINSFALNNGASETTSSTVTLNSSMEHTASHCMASEFSDFRDAAWSPYSSSVPFVLSPGLGLKTVYFKVKNAYGESAVVSDSIQLISPPAGSLTVAIHPQQAIDAGAQWRVDGGAWQNSGAMVPSLSSGQLHKVEFKDLAGWTKPVDQTLNIPSGQTVSTTGTYVALSGSIRVHISPSDVVALGAQWRVDGGPWRSSGDTAQSLAPGQHEVECKVVEGWNRPESQAINVSAGVASEVTLVYSKAPPQGTGPHVTISVLDNPNEVLESSRTPATFRISRNEASSGALTVKYSVGGSATNGSDYKKLTGSVKIPANAGFADILLKPRNDRILEGDETVVISLAADGAYQFDESSGTAVITILDDEQPLPTVSIQATDDRASEAGPDPGRFTISRTGSTQTALAVKCRVSGTAKNGSDYQRLSRFTIPAGQSSLVLTVLPKDDALVEPEETVIVTILPNRAYRVNEEDPNANSATVFISDNDQI